MRVAFVDRDGVINRNRDDYVKSVGEFEFLPGALEGLRKLKAAGWQVVVVSNQACVGRGLVPESVLADIDRAMVAAVADAGGEIRATYYCTHRSDEGCECRKPEPGLILRASRELGFDLRDAVLIGDGAEDIRAGKSAGCGTVAVLSGRISAEEAAALDPPPDFVAADLDEAARWIISRDN